MDKPIVNARLKFNCTTNWDEMRAVEGGKNCHVCQKKVYDLTNSSQGDFDLILAKNNYSICAKFSDHQMARQHIALPLWKKWLSAAMVLIGFNMLNNKAVAQTTQEPTAQKELTRRSGVIGEVIITTYNPAQFIGGPDSLNRFLTKNIQYKGKEGKVTISFDIKTTGELENPVIVSGLDPSTNEEAIRVFKLSPVWRPATLKGKPVASNFKWQLIFKK